MRPSVIVFDVNETLSDLSPLGARFVEVGASATAAALWFASVLRDGFALTAAGENPSFSGVARDLLAAQLSEVQLNRSVQDAAAHIMHGFAHLELHPDVAPGLEALDEAGFRLVTLSNGATSVADQLFTAAGVRDRFERLMSVTDAGAWKPTATAYQYAAKTCETEPANMLMVAVHPWDIDGARRAGMQTAWVNRSAGPYPASFLEPTITVSGLEELAEVVS